jgi:hypothetical protein
LPENACYESFIFDTLALAFGLFLVLGCGIVFLAGIISGSRRLLTVPAPLWVYIALSAITYPFTLWLANILGAMAILFLQPVVSLSIAAKLPERTRG